MPKTITMTVPRKGIAAGKARPSFETTGFVGEACKTGSNFLVQALGQVEEDKPTAEMYETEPTKEYLDEG